MDSKTNRSTGGPRQGRPGQGRPGQGRPGYGRPGQGRPGSRDKRPRGFSDDVKTDLSTWVPRTTLGKKVKTSEITSITEVLSMSTPIKEVEIIDKFLPEMGEEIINVGRVQRVTDSGRRTRFRVVMVVGNKNGYVGVGQAKGKEAGPTIRKAIERAKLNLKEIKRGCGSWECGCGGPHTVPFTVEGSAGSVRVQLSPAPRGTGLVSGEIAKKVLTLAGIQDVYVRTEGHTRTSINFAKALFNALAQTSEVKLNENMAKDLGVVTGLSLVSKDGQVEGS